jgi:hypothetical protein
MEMSVDRAAAGLFVPGRASSGEAANFEPGPRLVALAHPCAPRHKYVLYLKSLLQVFKGSPRAGKVNVAGLESFEYVDDCLDMRFDDLADMRFQ